MFLIKYPKGSIDLKMISVLAQYSGITPENPGTKRVIEGMDNILSLLVICMTGLYKP